MWKFEDNFRFYTYVALIPIFWFGAEWFYERTLPLCLGLFLLVMADFVYKLGNKIHVLDLMALNGILAYLLAPSLAYHFAEAEWYKGLNFMAITEAEYFHVAFPGTFGLLAGLNFPFKSTQIDHKVYFENVREYLKDKQEVGVHLFWIGVVSELLVYRVPSALIFLLTITSYLIYIGGLYIWFGDHKYKQFYLMGVFGIPIIKAAKHGMFGELIFWGVFMVLLLLFKYRVKLHWKISAAVLGLFVMLMIQSLKFEFRMNTWAESANFTLADRMSMMNEMVGERIDNPVLLFGQTTMTGALERTNQGYLTGMAIRYTPEYEPYAKGETIFMSIAASFIPRALWPDKPTVGGRENMVRFTGFDPGPTTSMDIGQLGDSYVNFGPWGGALCMFAYGLLFQFIFASLLQISLDSRASMMLWIPLFFAGTIQLETSILACVNHLMKTAFLTYMMVWGYKQVFRKEL